MSCCCDTAPASWQPSQPPVFCNELPLAVTLTRLVQTTFSVTAPLLEELELLDELVEPVVEPDELLLEEDVLLVPLLEEELELDELEVLPELDELEDELSAPPVKT